MIHRLEILGLFGALSILLALAPTAASADEDAYYRLLCDWSESARASTGVSQQALPTGECAVPAVTRAPQDFGEKDRSAESAERSDPTDEENSERFDDPVDRKLARPTLPPDDLDTRRSPVRDPNSDPKSEPTSRPSVLALDPERELRNRFHVPKPDVAARPGSAHGPVPDLLSVDRSPCDIPGSGCGGGEVGVTENPPVDLPPTLPGIVETPPSGCMGVPGCP